MLPIAGSRTLQDRELQFITDQHRVCEGVRAMLRLAGCDPNREGLADTPQRVLSAWLEQTASPGDPRELLATTFPADEYPPDQMISVGPTDFTSVCEHHLLPFTGTATIAYLPAAGRVVGLSKLPRLLDHYAQRPQVQERLTWQIAQAIDQLLAPAGVGVLIRAQHSCLSLRGARKTGTYMTTNVLLGAIRDEPATRAEFMALAREDKRHGSA